MQEKWRFFKKNRPLYAGIGRFRKGSTAGKQKKRREEKREGAPQVNRPKPDDIRRNGRRRRPAFNAGKWTQKKRANGGGAHRTSKIPR